eukprot:scaffold14021_cov21-Tisochrysis_lutea.AAC.1
MAKNRLHTPSQAVRVWGLGIALLVAQAFGSHAFKAVRHVRALQEYNICFTTVQRPADGSLPPLPESPGPGTPQAPLAHILASLVQRRRQVGLRVDEGVGMGVGVGVGDAGVVYGCGFGVNVLVWVSQAPLTHVLASFLQRRRRVGLCSPSAHPCQLCVALGQVGLCEDVSVGVIEGENQAPQAHILVSFVQRKRQALQAHILAGLVQRRQQQLHHKQVTAQIPTLTAACKPSIPWAAKQAMVSVFCIYLFTSNSLLRSPLWHMLAGQASHGQCLQRPSQAAAQHQAAGTQAHCQLNVCGGCGGGGGGGASRSLIMKKEV